LCQSSMVCVVGISLGFKESSIEAWKKSTIISLFKKTEPRELPPSDSYGNASSVTQSVVGGSVSRGEL
jgi:hypothetical protein